MIIHNPTPEQLKRACELKLTVSNLKGQTFKLTKFNSLYPWQIESETPWRQWTKEGKHRLDGSCEKDIARILDWPESD